jgi:hypothetical protein
VKNEIKILAIRRITVIFNRSLYLLFIPKYKKCKFNLLARLEIAELREEDMPMVY